MTELIIPDELAQRLHNIARRENRPLEAVLESLLEQYEQPDSTHLPESLEAFCGSLDTDITDLSVTVRETMDELYKRRFGNPD